MFKSFAETDSNEDGVWVPYKEAKDVEFQIRRIPPAKLEAMRSRVFGNRQEVIRRGKDAITPYDTEKGERLSRDRATWALVETRGVEFHVGGPGAAAAYTEALGRPVAVGDVVKMDGQWTERSKACVFRLHPDLVVWILEKADALADSAREEEEALRKN